MQYAQYASEESRIAIAICESGVRKHGLRQNVRRFFLSGNAKKRESGWALKRRASNSATTYSLIRNTHLLPDLSQINPQGVLHKVKSRAGEIPQKIQNTLSKWSIYLVMAMQTNKSENKSWQAVSVWISIFLRGTSSPNLTFPFDYNLLILPVVEEFKICPTTFIVKILKSRGTSVYWPWS